MLIIKFIIIVSCIVFYKRGFLNTISKNISTVYNQIMFLFVIDYDEFQVYRNVNGKCSSAKVVRLKAEHCIGDLLYSALQKLSVERLILANHNSARRQINASVHSAVVLYQGKEVSKLSKLVEYVYINRIRAPFELIWGKSQ